MVLRDVLRKKQDAKKCLTKLDTLVKLRVARQNTAKGRGRIVSCNEMLHFSSQIESLKSLWSNKLSKYETEEAELREKLNKETKKFILPLEEATNKIEQNLLQWQHLLFGGQPPQVDFNGNIYKFIKTRVQWDQYLSQDGKSLPTGWVVPNPSI